MLRQCSKLQIIMRYLCLPFSLRSVFLQVTGLKQMCEKSLMRKVTIGNMLEMLVLADMYKAPDLREATKYELVVLLKNKQNCRYFCCEDTAAWKIIFPRTLIVANSKELLKKRQWKERLKESGHLVFEILEAVIKKEEVNWATYSFRSETNEIFREELLWLVCWLNILSFVSYCGYLVILHWWDFWLFSSKVKVGRPLKGGVIETIQQ